MKIPRLLTTVFATAIVGSFCASLAAQQVKGFQKLGDLSPGGMG